MSNEAPKADPKAPKAEKPEVTFANHIAEAKKAKSKDVRIVEPMQKGASPALRVDH